MQRLCAQFLILAFLFNTSGPVAAGADEFVLPKPGTMVPLSPAFDPPVLKGIKVHPENPFRFDFILDKGQSQLADDQLKKESQKLIKYFLASLTVPEKDLWVNLSPYEKDRIVPEDFGRTEMGRDLLAQDYLLKQITASLIYPEHETGRKFWKRIYEEAANKFGTTDIPVNTFNKVWVVPEKAVVYENAKAGTAYVVESRLKVMLEEDYLAVDKNRCRPGDTFSGRCPQAGGQANKPLNAKATEGTNRSTLAQDVIKEIVLPQLTKEINEGKNFVQLRQVYNSLILAIWYKNKIEESILSQVYADKNKIAGVNLTADPLNASRIYQQYLQAFKKGVYNLIKEDIDPLTRQPIPRKYFSGGKTFVGLKSILRVSNDAAMLGDWVNKAKLIVMRAVLNTVPAGDIVQLKNGVSVIGYSWLSSEQLADINQLLSWARPQDLEGLKITVIPFWHPAAFWPLLKGHIGFQHEKGVVAIASLSRAGFLRLFLHELTHWVLRNKGHIEESLAEGIFDPDGMPKEGAVLPGLYAGKNVHEYVAQLAEYAASHPENDHVISERQRRIFLTDVFNISRRDFRIASSQGYVADRAAPYVASLFGHAVVLSIVYPNFSQNLLAGYAALTAAAGYLSAAGIPGAVTVNNKALRIIRALQNPSQIKMLAPALSIGIIFGLGAYGPTMIKDLFHGRSTDVVAVPFAKVEDPDAMTVELVFQDPDSRKEVPPELKGRFQIDDKRFLGDVPPIKTENPSFYGFLAMIYRYYGINKSPDELSQIWPEFASREVPATTYMGRTPTSIFRMDYVPKDGMTRDGFTVTVIPSSNREQAREKIIEALKQGHPVLGYRPFALKGYSVILGYDGESRFYEISRGLYKGYDFKAGWYSYINPEDLLLVITPENKTDQAMNALLNETSVIQGEEALKGSGIYEIKNHPLVKVKIVSDNKRDERRIRRILRELARLVPPEHVVSLKEIRLELYSRYRRGQTGLDATSLSRIILWGVAQHNNVTLKRSLLHEIGHIVSATNGGLIKKEAQAAGLDYDTLITERYAAIEEESDEVYVKKHDQFDKLVEIFEKNMDVLRNSFVTAANRRGTLWGPLKWSLAFAVTTAITNEPLVAFFLTPMMYGAYVYYHEYMLGRFVSFRASVRAEEDFAESYTHYVAPYLRKNFLEKGQSNSQLMAKYTFFDNRPEIKAWQNRFKEKDDAPLRSDREMSAGAASDNVMVNKSKADKSQLGGIDFNASQMDLQMPNAGQAIKFHVDPAMLKQLQNAPGFTPVIINIQPLADLRKFLGV